MNTERTIEVSAVVTPNCAIDNRNHMSSHRTLQNPETKKNQKNHTILDCLSQLDFALDAGIGNSYYARLRGSQHYTRYATDRLDERQSVSFLGPDFPMENADRFPVSTPPPPLVSWS